MADLAVWQRTIVDEEGNVIPGAEIEVRREEDDSLATLYADRAGETLLSNPLAADMSGFVRFFAQGDAYTITAVGAGSTRTWRFDPTGRLQEFDRVSEALVADDAADLLSARSNLGTFSSVAEVQSRHIPPVLDSIRTNGYYDPGDGGGALYKRVANEPSHNSKVQSADGSWWVPVVPFGYAFDSVSDMQASRLVTPGARVRTLGYYTPGDGGGNDYEIVEAGSGEDDGGSFIDLDGSVTQAKGLFEKGVNVAQFGARSDGTVDASSAINAALAFAANRDMREVSAIGRFLLLNPVVFPKSSQNLVLVGGGSAPLSSQNSSTYFDYQGPVDDDVAAVKVEGRSTGSAVRGVYIACNERTGYGLLLQSVFAAAYSDVVVEGYRKKGLVLTIHPDATSDAWYTSKNTFDRVRVVSGFPGAQALHLLGVKTETRRNGVWGNVFSGCTLGAGRVLDKSLLPAALYLGYCDSNEFIKCDFGLSGGSVTQEFAASLYDLVNRNGASLTDGRDWFVRDTLTPFDEVPPTRGPRWTGIFRFDQSSTETPDGVNVLAPQDNVGRFIKYQGTGIITDGNMMEKFPANNCFHQCSIASSQSFVDVTSNGNVIGDDPENPVPSCNMFPYATLDNANIPHHIPHIGGVTDNGRTFGYHGWDVAGGPLLLTDANHLRRVKLIQNSGPGTGNGGLDITFESRAWDASPWGEISKLNISPSGIISGDAVTQSAVDSTAGKLMKVGDFGVGARNGSSESDLNNYDIPGTTWSLELPSAQNSPLSSAYGYLTVQKRADGRLWQEFRSHSNQRVYYRVQTSAGTWADWREMYSTVNTTVDSNGFIKEASPVISLYDSHIEKNDHPEISEATFEKVGTGHYIIRGTPALSRNGWYIETPKDRNGNVYFTLDYEEGEDALTIRTFEPDYSTGPARNGAPVDILDGRFVSLRFQQSEVGFVEE